jgi:hypothetical protein
MPGWRGQRPRRHGQLTADGVWLIVKGFKPSPITAEMTVPSTPLAYQDLAV